MGFGLTAQMAVSGVTNVTFTTPVCVMLFPTAEKPIRNVPPGLLVVELIVIVGLPAAMLAVKPVALGTDVRLYSKLDGNVNPDTALIVNVAVALCPVISVTSAGFVTKKSDGVITGHAPTIGA